MSSKGSVSASYPTMAKTWSFLSSLALDKWEDKRCHPQALKYIKAYSENKEELAKLLYDLYNEKAFGGALPRCIPIRWNRRLQSAAGQSVFYRTFNRSTRQPVGRPRSISVELSTKILNSPSRLRDTLAHELCHVATLVVSGKKDGHGDVWKQWTRQFMDTCPDLPNISRCHSYDIEKKYGYQCVLCKRVYPRQKRVNVTVARCGGCKGNL